MDDLQTLKGFFQRLGITQHNVERSLSGGSPLTSSFECNAEHFLQTAEDAFELSNYSTALSDAKRAIYCQVDEILDCLGYPWKNKPIPPKLELVKKCGFAAPRILKRVNAARNLLEHEYVQPSSEQTEEALDIATLFVDASRRHLESFMGEFYVGISTERVDEFHYRRELVFGFDNKSKAFEISAHEDVPPERDSRNCGSVVGELTVASSSLLFPTLIKLTIAGERDSKVSAAFHELFELFRVRCA